MTSSGAAAQAQALRDRAATLLQEAAQSRDRAVRDDLTRRALVQIEKARRLLEGGEPPSNPQVAGLH